MSACNRMRYLRVSLSSGCNLRCSYCQPEGNITARGAGSGEPELVKASINLLMEMGITKIRFTGGEPTLYRHLADIVAYTRSLDETAHIAITSNGILLPELASKLAEAGLDSVNISMDTLDRQKFRTITSVDALDKVVSGIEAGIEQIGNVKLNCVLMRGVNDDEAGAMVEFADRLGVTIRFIEYMPSRSIERNQGQYISGGEIMARLGYSFVPIGSDSSSAAKYYSAPGLDIPVGFINPVSHPFCADCDRLRLAADGKLYGCLFSSRSVNLFELLQSGEETARREIEKLIESKQYLGCAGAAHSPDNLPSFIEMGG